MKRGWTSAPQRRKALWQGLAGSVCAGVLLLPASPAMAQGGTVTGDKTVSATDIPCDGSTNVTVTVNGQTGIAGQPVDIMLVLDRSGSMQGQPFADLKAGANAFVDIIDQATDSALNGVIANGSRVGVVSFSDNATVNQPLTSNAGAVKSAINGLSANGNTNHSAAFQTAQAQLAGSQPTNKKILIMFTDGETTVGGNPNGVAAAARAAGTEIYAIGLGDADVAALNNWATDPDSQHVFVAPDSSQLQAIFQAIGAAIVVPAATNVQVADTVSSHFAVTNPCSPPGWSPRSGC